MRLNDFEFKAVFGYFRRSASQIFRYQRLVFFFSLAMSCQEDWSHQLTPVPAIPTPGATGSSTRNWPRECYFNMQFWLILWNQTILKEKCFFCDACFSSAHCRLLSGSENFSKKTFADQISVSSSGSSGSEMEDLSSSNLSPLRYKVQVTKLQTFVIYYLIYSINATIVCSFNISVGCQLIKIFIQMNYDVLNSSVEHNDLYFLRHYII